MELSKKPEDEKKLKSSFWNKILRLPRKSQIKVKHEDSFRRQSMLYSSLGAAKQETQSNSTSDESENFTTLECSALMDVHRDAGILFVNKSSVSNCFPPKEEPKHVQFVPTPLNKYYRVDVQSAPSKRQNEENKENLEQIKYTKPTRPILRSDRSRRLSFHSSVGEDTQSNPETRLVNVSYIDGPEVKTPSIPRTSTKLALIDRKNGSLPQLNVSGINRCRSLPRNKKIGENMYSSENSEITQFSSDLTSDRSLCIQPNQNSLSVAYIERHRGSIRNLNAHRQSCYGVSDPSRIFEGKKVLQPQYQSTNQNLKQRLSLGGPVFYQSQKVNDSKSNIENILPTDTSLGDPQKNLRRFLKKPARNLSYARSLDQPIQISNPQHGTSSGNNKLSINKQIYHASTGNIPNRAINEVGIPLVANIRDKDFSNTKGKHRSISPLYIPLCETFSNNKIGLKKDSVPENANCIKRQLNAMKMSETEASQKQKLNSGSNAPVHCTTSKTNVSGVNECGAQTTCISDTRKHAIKTAMYTQKRKIMNKICKYKCKESEDGFSSMADDECSFNCSCPSCIAKLSRSYKRKSFFINKDNKYFFTIQPDIKEGNETERLPENQTFEGPMTKAQPHLSTKNNSESVVNKTWYDCNDTLCQTPTKSGFLKKIDGNCQEAASTPVNKAINIYENIAEIINSATKKNFSSQDVKRILSTPISSPLRIGITSSLTRPQNVLFPENADNEHKALNRSLKIVFTPTKSPDCLNDSIVLLQEIFQKLSQECRDLLKPNASLNNSDDQKMVMKQNSPGRTTNKYVNDLVKNLKSSDLSGADFANIIGGIAQNIFSETKAKSTVKALVHSNSLPDLQKKESLLNKAISVANSLKDLCNVQITQVPQDQSVVISLNDTRTESTLASDSMLGSRKLPDGWSRTPSSESSNVSNDASSTKLSSSGTDKESSKYSESELQLLENAIRLGMGLNPAKKTKKTSMFSASPVKATKYKSRDVLSGKGK